MLPSSLIIAQLLCHLKEKGTIYYQLSLLPMNQNYIKNTIYFFTLHSLTGAKCGVTKLSFNSNLGVCEASFYSDSEIGFRFFLKSLLCVRDVMISVKLVAYNAFYDFPKSQT